MIRACTVCAARLPDQPGPCPSCGAIGRVLHLQTASDLLMLQEKVARRGGPPARGARRGPYRLVAPFMLALGAVFLLAGVVQALLAARGGTASFTTPMLLGAVVPLAWGVALVVFARALGRGGVGR